MPFGSLSWYRVCGTDRMSVQKYMLQHTCTYMCKEVTHNGLGEKKRRRRSAFNIEKLEMIPYWAQASLQWVGTDSLLHAQSQLKVVGKGVKLRKHDKVSAHALIAKLPSLNTAKSCMLFKPDDSVYWMHKGTLHFFELGGGDTGVTLKRDPKTDGWLVFFTSMCIYNCYACTQLQPSHYKCVCITMAI